MQERLEKIMKLNVYFKNRESFSDKESKTILKQLKQDPINNDDKVYI